MREKDSLSSLVKRWKKPSRESAAAMSSSSSSGAPAPPATEPAGVVRKEGAERGGGDRRRGGDGPRPLALEAAAAVEDLELRVAEDERVAGTHRLEPVKAVPKAREVREEVPLDDALDCGDVGVLVEHLRAAALQ